MTETIRIAENTKKVLRAEACSSKYKKGVYDGFNLVLSMLAGVEFKTYDESQEFVKSNKTPQN